MPLLDWSEDDEIAATALRERFRRFPLPWWCVKGARLVGRINQDIVEECDLSQLLSSDVVRDRVRTPIACEFATTSRLGREPVPRVDAYGVRHLQLPPDIKEAAVAALVRMLRAELRLPGQSSDGVI